MGKVRRHLVKPQNQRVRRGIVRRSCAHANLRTTGRYACQAWLYGRHWRICGRHVRRVPRRGNRRRSNHWLSADGAENAE